MKANLTSRSSLLAFLMVVLLLSSSLATLAQQIPAEVQAKRDAKNDVNKFAWITGGFIGCAAGGTVITLLDKKYIAPRDPLVEAWSVPLSIFGATVSTCSPFVYAISASSAPPTERLLGKSSEYVNVYVDS